MQTNNPTEHQTINTKQFIKGLYIVQATKTTGETTTQKLIIQLQASSEIRHFEGSYLRNLIEQTSPIIV